MFLLFIFMEWKKTLRQLWSLHWHRKKVFRTEHSCRTFILLFWRIIFGAKIGGFVIIRMKPTRDTDYSNVRLTLSPAASNGACHLVQRHLIYSLLVYNHLLHSFRGCAVVEHSSNHLEVLGLSRVESSRVESSQVESSRVPALAERKWHKNVGCF
jgi:hypothetical protein